jgi:hypothetical protein
VFEGTADKPTDATLLSTPVMTMSADGHELGMLPESGIQADGSFQTIGLPPGQYEVMFWMTAPAWSLASIVVDGREMIGQSLELGAADLTGAVFTFTDHPSQLSGIVRDEAGNPDADATIYVFSTDRQRWANTAPTGGTAHVVRPARNGGYQTTLVPGEYFVLAVEATQAGWLRTDVLDTLARSAKTVKIAAAQSATLDLTVPKGK